MDKVLLDTDIFSEILKGINQRVAIRACTYRNALGCYTISTITVLEIVKGWHKRQREDKIQELFIEIAAAEVLTLQLNDAELAGRIGSRFRTNRTTDRTCRLYNCCDRYPKKLNLNHW